MLESSEFESSVRRRITISAMISSGLASVSIEQSSDTSVVTFGVTDAKGVGGEGLFLDGVALSISRGISLRLDHQSANPGKTRCPKWTRSLSLGLIVIGVQLVVLTDWLTGNSGEIPGRSPPL
jgi:hypothetical protein